MILLKVIYIPAEFFIMYLVVATYVAAVFFRLLRMVIN